MHQRPRPSPRTSTPATNPTTNPERTNNSRDQPPSRTRSSVDLASYTERAGGEASMARNESTASGSQGTDNTRLNQIIQHFHTKAALMICSSRANLPQVQAKNGEIRQNRWFNIVLDETDVLLDDLQEWKRPNLYEDRPSPLVIEVFVDTAQLAHTQSLVIVDDSGKRTEVAEALASSAGSSPHPSKSGARFCEVVLERWTIELGSPEGYGPAELNDLLPNVYKKGVVLFRSLYTFLRFLPAWRLYRKLGRQVGGHNALRLKFRIRQAQGLARGQKDSLYTPLCPSEHELDDVVESYTFQPLVTPAGPLHCALEYRKNCSFGVAEAESLLSSQFLQFDQGLPTLPTGGSLPGERTDQPRGKYSSTAAPTTTTRDRPRGLLGAYGSLGTFHGSDRRGSPVSELKQRAIEADNEDEMDRADDSGRRRVRNPNWFEVGYKPQEGSSIPIEPRYEPEALPAKAASPPFKHGSLADAYSPSSRPGLYLGPGKSPSTSAPKTESMLLKYAGASVLAPTSKRTSLNVLPQQQLRTPIVTPEVAVASPSSSSPKPPKFVSSFGDRKNRFSSQGSKAGESNASSGRGSSDSKEKSDQLAEGTAGDSSSTRTDDDDIASFISSIEQAKDIKFHTPPSQRDNVINLTKYSQLRDPNTQLADEMSSSSLIQASSTPPSRRLSNVPGLSTSSSPSRALAHTPHVRSRLSTHSIAEEATRSSRISGASAEGSDSPKILQEEDEEDEEPFIFQHDNIQDENV